MTEPPHETKTPSVEEVAEEKPPREIAWWRVAMLGAGALVLALALLGLVVLTAHALALLFIAIVIAEAIAPLVSRLERLMPRGAAVFALYLAMLAALAGGVWLLVPRIAEQGQEIIAELPALIEEGETELRDMGVTEDGTLLDTLQSNIGRFGDILVDVPMMVATSVTQVVLVFFMSAYWLLTKRHLHEFMRSLVPRDERRAMDDTLAAMGSTVGGYVRGQVISGLIVGVLIYIGLTVLGVRFALVLAIIAAVAELIPVIGPIIAAVPAVAVALLDSPTQALIVLGFYFVLQQIESNLIIPKVMDNQADIPPLLVIVALFAGAGVGGILGALVAIPLAGALKVIVVRVAAPAIRRWTGANDATPATRVSAKGPRRAASG